MNFLIIDVGTSSMRGNVFQHDGTLLNAVQIKYKVTAMENGNVEQNPLDFKNSLFEIATQTSAFLKNRGVRLDAIAITSQRSSVIPVDEQGNHLSNAIMWQDKRTVPICEEMLEHNQEVFEYSGARINPVFSGTKMSWLKRYKPDIYIEAHISC